MDRLIQELNDRMREEISLLADFCSIGENIRKAIQENDWEAMSRYLEHLRVISDETGEVEALRHEIYQEILKQTGNSAGKGFYNVIVTFPEPYREEAFSLYREMKLTVLRIQGITWCIDAHVKTITGTLHHVLNEIFPYRKGKLYKRDGSANAVTPDPLLISRTM